jgi:sugar/nucleoside kinase (ribokinase family)
MEQEYDFVAVGDTVTDAFISIAQASVYKEHDQDGDGTIDEELCFLNGAKIPYEEATIIPAVGNSANAAVSAVRLGLRTAFVADVGADEHGKEILATLEKQGVDTRFVRSHEGMTSNYHYVLMHGPERTILIKHEKYPYKLPDNLGNPKWLYFSSVGDDSLYYHQEIADYLGAHPGVKLAFQPGSYQIKMGKDALKDLYARTEIFFCNVEEARLILKTTEPDAGKLPKMMSTIGPKLAVVTDGPRGAYAYDSYNGKSYFMPPYPDPKPPVSRTGAGDACSSTITVALALGKPLEEALQWGPINSMNVVQHVGAQTGLLTRPALEELLATKPADYFAKEING